jgi:hypothetical protein
MARGRSSRKGPASRSPGARALVGAAATALLAAAVVLAVTNGGGHAALTLRAAAAPTLRAATAPAPRESAGTRFLAAAVEGVRFPYWEESFGWRSSGARSDTVAGRAVKTVFYSSGNTHIGYSIYSGVPAPRLGTSSSSSSLRIGGTRYAVSVDRGTAIISWQRAGHLCVMSGHGISARSLARLASSDEAA